MFPNSICNKFFWLSSILCYWLTPSVHAYASFDLSKAMITATSWRQLIAQRRGDTRASPGRSRQGLRNMKAATTSSPKPMSLQPLSATRTSNASAFVVSKLFSSSSAFRRQISAKQQYTLGRRPRKTQFKLVSALSWAMVTCLTFPKLALASSLAGTRTSSAWNAMRSTIPLRRFVQVAISIFLLNVLISTVRMKRRQVKDATSEWGRFARHPAARGRAIIWLVIQQAGLVLASRLVGTLFLQTNLAASLRRYAGRHFAQSLLQLGPLYIKLGQIMSCRKNLLGEEWIVAMARLQDQVPARTGQDATVSK